MRPLILVLIAFSMCSCQSLLNKLHHRGKTAAKPEIDPQSPTFVGSIEMVNPEAHFVVVRLASNLSVPEGTEFFSVSADGKVAKLKVTPERKGALVTADVVEGDPHQGDAVARSAQAAAAATTNAQPAPGAEFSQRERPTISISPSGQTAEPALPSLPPAPAPSEFLRIVPPTTPQP